MPPTQSAAVRLYAPPVISAAVVGKLLKLEGVVKHPAVTVRMRIYRLYRRLGTSRERPGPAAKRPKIAQLSACGEI